MYQINGNLELEVNVCYFKLMGLIARENLINAEVPSPNACYFNTDKKSNDYLKCCINRKIFPIKKLQ
jgi:hypothetical protein